MNLFSLKDEIAFVTGAGSGIGQGIAIGLAEAGADVALFDLPASEGLDDTDQAIKEKGRRALDRDRRRRRRRVPRRARSKTTEETLWAADARRQLRRHRQRARRPRRCRSSNGSA